MVYSKWKKIDNKRNLLPFFLKKEIAQKSWSVIKKNHFRETCYKEGKNALWVFFFKGYSLICIHNYFLCVVVKLLEKIS